MTFKVEFEVESIFEARALALTHRIVTGGYETYEQLELFGNLEMQTFTYLMHEFASCVPDFVASMREINFDVADLLLRMEQYKNDQRSQQ